MLAFGLLVVALLATTVRPTLILDSAPYPYGFGFQQALFVVALGLQALHHGVRTTWLSPLVVFPLVFMLSLALGTPTPGLSLMASVAALAVLVLPFAIADLVQADDRQRHQLALLIAILPLISVAIGLAIQAAGGRPAFLGLHDRLEGAMGNPGIFALLAFGGFAAAVDGFTRGRAVFGLLAALDLACIILSGARMALLATALLLACLLLTSAAFRERLKRAKLLLMGTLSGLTVLAVGYGPTLIRRTLMHNRAGGLDVFRRADTWQFYLDDWLASPWFGRGFGSGFVAGPERVLDVVPPHDEYLHLLLIGGIVGGALLLVSITRWAWRLFRDAPPDARPFVLSLGLALAFYAIAENLLAYVAALPVFAYLGLVARSAARERPS